MNPLLIRILIGGAAGYLATTLYERLTGSKSATTIEGNEPIGKNNDPGETDSRDSGGRPDNGGDTGSDEENPGDIDGEHGDSDEH